MPPPSLVALLPVNVVLSTSPPQSLNMPPPWYAELPLNDEFCSSRVLEVYRPPPSSPVPGPPPLPKVLFEKVTLSPSSEPPLVLTAPPPATLPAAAWSATLLDTVVFWTLTAPSDHRPPPAASALLLSSTLLSSQSEPVTPPT